MSRSEIVSTALAIIDAEGLDSLTMRRMADELGVGVMSLYRHVRDRDDVLDAVGELLAMEVAVQPAGGRRWHAGVHRLLSCLRDVARAHPEAFPLLAFRPVATEAAQQRVADALQLLEASGLDPRRRAVLARTLVSFVNGFVLAELRGTTTFPDEPAPDVSFRQGIEIILAGA